MIAITKDKIHKYILALIIVQYIEDITWLRGSTKFLFECFMSGCSERVKYFFNMRREISYLQAAT